MKIKIYNIAFFLIIFSFVSCASSNSNFKLGKQYYDEGNFEQAIVELEKAAIHDESIYDRISAFEYLGDAYTRNGNLDRAVLSYENAYNLIRMQIGEVIDRQKALKNVKLTDSSLGSHKSNSKREQLYDEQSKLNIRAAEVRVKIEHLKSN
jgi:tetratricopeptide (TPR) repeat protein